MEGVCPGLFLFFTLVAVMWMIWELIEALLMLASYSLYLNYLSSQNYMLEYWSKLVNNFHKVIHLQ